MEISNAFCLKCKKDRKFLLVEVNHVKHFLLSCCSFGAWLAMWGILYCNRNWICLSCHSQSKPIILNSLAIKGRV